MRHWPYIVTATKIRQFIACERLPFMDEHRDPAEAQEPVERLLDYDLGIRHERDVGDELRAGRFGAELVRPAVIEEKGREAFTKTLALMRRGQSAIEQGLLIHDDWWGRPDYLYKRPGRSLLGGWHYEPADAKVGGRKTVLRSQILPVAFYALLLERIQGVLPSRFTIYRGQPGAREAPPRDVPIETKDHVAAATYLVTQLREVLGGDRDPGPRLTSECSKCKWQAACVADATERRDLSLITGMRRDVRSQIESLGIRTVDDLAGIAPTTLATIPGVNAAWAQRAIEQARAWVQSEHSGRPRLTGTHTIPPRTKTEIYLDIEGEGVDNKTDAVLFGLLIRRGSRATYWNALADSADNRRRAWRALGTKLDTLPTGVPILHFGGYDAQLVAGMCAAHGRPRDLERRLIDVHARIAPHLVMLARGTGLRPLAAALGFRRGSPMVTGQMASYWWREWATSRDREARANLLRHNEDDLRALAAVMDWLRESAPPIPPRGNAVEKPRTAPRVPRRRSARRSVQSG